jgi:hypothetical protein
MKKRTMELHHPHVEKKSFKEYFFEFIMIFLAVTLGFFAENIREHRAEHEREIQFMHSLLEDLKIDTAQVSNYIRFYRSIRNYCDSIQLTIAQTNIFRNSNDFYNYTRKLAQYNRYYHTDRTIQQLKNAGNMRLIRKWNVSNAITEYDTQTKLLAEIDQQLNDEIIRYREYLIQFLDLSSYDKSNPFGSFMDMDVHTRSNPGFISEDSKKSLVIYNQAFTLKIFLNGVENSARSVFANGKQLIDLVQKEYEIH